MIINCFENYDFSDIYKNKEDIGSNLREINYLKNNTYIKNVYNILFYNKKLKSILEKIFYEKVFNVNAKQNDFVEISFKIDLQYNDISERNYVKSVYEIFDENNNSLYIKSINNNEYSYCSNRVIIDENIFYNFNKVVKKIEFIIKFQKLLSSRVIYLYYIKNNNYRLTIKNYEL